MNGTASIPRDRGDKTIFRSPLVVGLLLLLLVCGLFLVVFFFY